MTRRTLKDIKRYVSPEEVLSVIENAKFWPYKTKPDFYKKRDRALLALLALSGGRINEVLRLDKSQFDFNVDPDFIVIKDFEISKRKKVTIQREGIPKIDFPLPLAGSFKPFTQIVQDYLPLVEKKLFKFHRNWAYKLVNHMTGLWCHWFRSQKLSYAVNLHKSALIAAKLHGIKNPLTVAHYYKTEWERHRRDLLK